MNISFIVIATRYFANPGAKKTAGNEMIHYPAEFVNQIYPKVLLIVFWTKFANCNGSLPHLALAECLQLLLQALAIVRL